jgi:hypothetical protein
MTFIRNVNLSLIWFFLFYLLSYLKNRTFTLTYFSVIAKNRTFTLNIMVIG